MNTIQLSPRSGLLNTIQPSSTKMKDCILQRVPSSLKKSSQVARIFFMKYLPWANISRNVTTLANVHLAMVADDDTREVEEAENGDEILKSIQSLGATLDNHGGVVFRVWAPHADAAFVSIYDEHSKPGPLLPMQNEGLNWSKRIPGVQEGDKYHFVFSHKGQIYERRDARARKTDYDSNACYVVNPSFDWSEYKAPTWDELLIYQLHVGSFTGREENGGTFKSLESKLDYIKDLGFTAIQMLPIHEYCGSWGYNPRLLFSIHPMYGSPADLRNLVNSAHKKGLSVIFDVVLNHGAARMNSLWAYDGWNENNGGGLYFEGGRDTPFGKGFAWWQGEVIEMIIDCARMFLTEYNGDGLRFDCVHEMPWKVLQKTTQQLRHEFPGKILISEITPETPSVVHDAGFDSTWIHSSFYDMRAFMEGKKSLRKLESLIALHPGFSSVQCVKYFLGCHDQTGCRKNGSYDPEIQGFHRYSVELLGGRGSWEARAKVRMWYSAMITASGIPLAFMGSEFCHGEWWGVDQGHLLQWALSVDEIGCQTKSLVRSANKMRERFSCLRFGGVRTVHFDQNNVVLGFIRESEDCTLLVVMNASGNQWEKQDYAVQTGSIFGGEHVCEVFNSQAAQFGGWESSGNREKLIPQHEGRIFVNIPKWSVLVFGEVGTI